MSDDELAEVCRLTEDFSGSLEAFRATSPAEVDEILSLKGEIMVRASRPAEWWDEYAERSVE